VRRIIETLLVALLLMPGTSLAAPVSELRKLLDNAGYNTGGEPGQWTPDTSSALAEFSERYGIAVGDTSDVPDDATITSLVAAAQAKLDTEYATFPTKPLPQEYFVGFLDANWFDIHTWAKWATVNRDGHAKLVPVERYYQPLDEDVSELKKAGVQVIRSPLGMDGALFFDECHYDQGGDERSLNACYAKAYANAAANKWVKQTELLGHLADDPVIKLYLDSVEAWNAAGFHVLVVPMNYFHGTEGTTATSVALFHRALMRDKAFRTFYPKFVAAVLAELKKRGPTNISVQSASEPAFCSAKGNTGPGPGELATWQAVERAELDAIRRIAPRIAFTSTAVCAASVGYFIDERHPYTDLEKLMPFHEGMDGVTYSFHLYAPGALFFAGAQESKYVPGTAIHFPFKALPASAAANDRAKKEISIYNRVKPNGEFLQKIFSDAAAFAKARNIRLIVTETAVPKPDFGIPREDRLALVRGLIDASRAKNVPIVYSGIFGAWGISSCPDDNSIADHRFDPAMLNIFAWGNGVAGADPDAALTPLEASCGPTLATRTAVQFSHGEPADLKADTAFETTVFKTGAKIAFNISGGAGAPGQPLDQIALQFFEPLSEKQARALQTKCGGDLLEFDGAKHARIHLSRADTTFTIYAVNCYRSALGKPAGDSVGYVVQNLPTIVADMAAAGGVEAVPNDLLRGWLQDVADGKIKIIASKDVPPPRETETFEEFSGNGPNDAEFNTLLKTKTRAVGEIDYNVRGKTIRGTGVFIEVAIVLPDPTSEEHAEALSEKCGIGSDSWEGGKHPLLRFVPRKAAEKTIYTLSKFDCIKANFSKGEAADVDILVSKFGQIARDMVDSGNVNSVTTLSLREFMKAVADDQLVLTATP
jgi:hypothetical protein